MNAQCAEGDFFQEKKKINFKSCFVIVYWEPVVAGYQVIITAINKDESFFCAPAVLQNHMQCSCISLKAVSYQQRHSFTVE